MSKRNMTSLTNSVSYPVITVKNVYCNNIRVSKCDKKDNYIAMFIFDNNAAVYELLLDQMKRESKQIADVAVDLVPLITCDPVLLNKDMYVIDSTRTHTDDSCNSVTRRRCNSTLSMTKLDQVPADRKVFMSRIDMVFNNVCMYKKNKRHDNKWAISYSDLQAHIVSSMRNREVVS